VNGIGEAIKQSLVSRATNLAMESIRQGTMPDIDGCANQATRELAKLLRATADILDPPNGYVA